MKNVEIKFELRDPSLARTLCLHFGARPIATLEQTDTYFRVPDGRLKKRETTAEPTEYIIYERTNQARPRISSYSILLEQQAIERFGSNLPVWVTVRKRREVLLHGNVRIHLDEVEDLGHFLELEAVVSTSIDETRCHEAVRKIREALAPALGEPIAYSYADLIAQPPTDEDGAG